jgi:hypothetical protein
MMVTTVFSSSTLNKTRYSAPPPEQVAALLSRLHDFETRFPEIAALVNLSEFDVRGYHEVDDDDI